VNTPLTSSLFCIKPLYFIELNPQSTKSYAILTKILSLKSLTFSLNNPRSSSPISSAQPLTLYAVEVVQVLLPASAISPAGHDGQGWVLRGLGAIEGTRSSLEVEQEGQIHSLVLYDTGPDDEGRPASLQRPPTLQEGFAESHIKPTGQAGHIIMNMGNRGSERDHLITSTGRTGKRRKCAETGRFSAADSNKPRRRVPRLGRDLRRAAAAREQRGSGPAS
jgi:hypothetical protein